MVQCGACVRHTADLNQSWEVKPDGAKAIGLTMNETLKLSADLRVTQVTIQGKARIVTAEYDSAKLSTYSALAQKSQQNVALANAIRYFNEETIDDEKPLYGIYKAVEALTAALPGGRGKLGMLAGHGKRYVDDIMQTSGLTRQHNNPNARPILTDQQCKERAKILIDAFAKSI